MLSDKRIVIPVILVTIGILAAVAVVFAIDLDNKKCSDESQMMVDGNCVMKAEKMVYTPSDLWSGDKWADKVEDTTEYNLRKAIANNMVKNLIQKFDKEDKSLNGMKQADLIYVLTGNTNGQSFMFVIDTKSQNVAAHPDIDLLNFPSYDLQHAQRPADEVIKQLEENDGVWIYYDIINPDSGDIEPKQSWLVMHEQYIFGTGFHQSDIMPTN